MLRKDIIEKARRHTCPLCGGKLNVKKLTVNLDTNTAAFQGRAVQLYPKHAEIVHALLRTDRMMPISELITRVWGVNSDVNETTVKTTLGTARCLLGQIGWTIKAKYGRGYSLVQL